MCVLVYLCGYLIPLPPATKDIQKLIDTVGKGYGFIQRARGERLLEGTFEVGQFAQDHGAGIVERVHASEVLPEAQRNGRELQAATPTGSK